MTGVPLAPRPLTDLAARHGGVLRNGASGVVRRLVPIDRAGAGDLAPLLSLRYVPDAVSAIGRGALLLADEELASRDEIAGLPAWVHPHAAWTLAELLETGDVPEEEPVIGEGCRIGPGAVILPRVVLGARVTIGAGAVIGAPGFGFALGRDGATREIPQLGGVIIEDDVHIGPLCTIACGTLGPTIIRRGAKLDAQVHIGHNCEIGANAIIAAQSGIAGSVTVGRGVMMGGQVGVADHLRIGDGARIAAKSGVIGDIAPGATVAGYPAVERHRWLRGLAELYRIAANRASTSARSPESLTPQVPPSRPTSVPGTWRGATIPPPPSVPPGVRPEAIIRRSEPPTEGEA